MVGHTGDLRATIQAVEALDLSLARLLRAIEAHHGLALITADHGNADEMYMRLKGGGFEAGRAGPRAKTSHTLNPVPLTLFDPHGQTPGLAATVEQPGLANIAATIVELLGFKPPSSMHRSLVAPR